MSQSLAKLIDLALLHPTMTDAEMRAGCEKAKKLGVASVCIKPYAVKLAAELLKRLRRGRRHRHRLSAWQQCPGN